MVRSPTRLADLLGVGVDDGDDPVAAGAEAPVVGEGVAEVPDADDGDGPVVGEAQLARDLVEQVVDVVADAAGAVGAEVREVLADLGRVDARQLGQPLRRDRADLLVGASRAGPGSRAGGGRRSPRGCGERRESGLLVGRRRRARRSTPERTDLVHVFSKSAVSYARRRGRGGLAFVAVVVSSLFAQAMLVRYTAGHQPQNRAWAIALAMFALASAALATGTSTGWDNGTFRVFFLLGAVVNVPWLAMGTVYLLRRRGDARRVPVGPGAVQRLRRGRAAQRTDGSRCTAPRSRWARTSSARCPRILAAVGQRRGRGRDHRRRGRVGGPLRPRPQHPRPRPARRRQRADRAGHARALERRARPGRGRPRRGVRAQPRRRDQHRLRRLRPRQRHAPSPVLTSAWQNLTQSEPFNSSSCGAPSILGARASPGGKLDGIPVRECGRRGDPVRRSPRSLPARPKPARTRGWKPAHSLAPLRRRRYPPRGARSLASCCAPSGRFAAASGRAHAVPGDERSERRASQDEAAAQVSCAATSDRIVGPSRSTNWPWRRRGCEQDDDRDRRAPPHGRRPFGHQRDRAPGLQAERRRRRSSRSNASESRP